MTPWDWIVAGMIASLITFVVGFWVRGQIPVPRPAPPPVRDADDGIQPLDPRLVFDGAMTRNGFRELEAERAAKDPHGGPRMTALILALLLAVSTTSGSALRPDHGPGDVSRAPSAGLSGAPGLLGSDQLARLGDARFDSEQLAPGAPSRVGSALQEGVATWCAPTPKYCHGWGGDALLGAVPGYVGPAYTVIVRRGSRSVAVRVVSWCACGDRVYRGQTWGTIIDLSPAAFRELAPQRLGVIRVTVERFDGRVLPPTDTIRQPHQPFMPAGRLVAS